jgi:aspartyl/asparaginyl-tRNA synthetase
MDKTHPDFVDPFEYSEAIQKVREYYYANNLVEVDTQTRRSILAACEDPSTITKYEYEGQIWPLPQTGQMWLEHERMTYPDVPGFFCETTSYRQEPNPVPGRHNKQFKMSEAEINGGLEELIKFQEGLLTHLGYDPKKFVRVDYEEMCKKYNTTTIEHEHELMLYRDYGPTVWLCRFPERANSFWNMKRDKDQYSLKVDVIMSGQETIGSAERSCNVDEMRHDFYRNSGGMYAKTLFNHFGKQRVEDELHKYFEHKFYQRSGYGMGMTRLIRSMKMEGLLGKLKNN